MTLAALLSAIGVTKSSLKDQKIVVYGAGSAGLGIAHQIRDAMMETDGLDREEANGRFWLIDKEGLITQSIAKKAGEGGLRKGLEEFVRSDEEWKDSRNGDGVGLLDVVKKVHPTVLIGTSTQAGAFSEDVVREMSKGTKRPIIFPLSNPSKLVKVKPEDANKWSGDKAPMATGSPFPAVKMGNGKEYM